MRNGAGLLADAGDLVEKTLADLLSQVTFQHADSTYLGLLGALAVPSGPLVTTVSPSTGEAGPRPSSTAAASTPTPSSISARPRGVEVVRDLSGTQITATVPDGVGIVGVRVTTVFGTSPAVPLGQFAYGGPAPVVVSAVTPRSGEAGTQQVVIGGSGFADGATVWCKDVAATVEVSGPRPGSR
ncbi:hypothetical protein [Streptomyces sp. NPDC045470]|uniref:hypothetical protein n=1 Tax=Streptomyces sp. NPDC045470 TaxID=3155469 RepID=UPI0033E52228